MFCSRHPHIGDDFQHILLHLINLENLMATQANTFESFQAQLTTLQQSLDQLKTDFNNAIAALKQQVANGTPISQAQLDTLASMVNNIQASVTAEDQAVTGTAASSASTAEAPTSASVPATSTATTGS